jgi:hypothetical protein
MIWANMELFALFFAFVAGVNFGTAVSVPPSTLVVFFVCCYFFYNFNKKVV